MLQFPLSLFLLLFFNVFYGSVKSPSTITLSPPFKPLFVSFFAPLCPFLSTPSYSKVTILSSLREVQWETSNWKGVRPRFCLSLCSVCNSPHVNLSIILFHSLTPNRTRTCWPTDPPPTVCRHSEGWGFVAMETVAALELLLLFFFNLKSSNKYLTLEFGRQNIQLLAKGMPNKVCVCGCEWCACVWVCV